MSPRKKTKEKHSKEKVDKKDDIASTTPRKGPRFPSLTPTKSRRDRASMTVAPLRDDSPDDARTDASESHSRQSSDYLPLSRLAKDARPSTSMLSITSRKEIRSEGVAELRKVKSNTSLVETSNKSQDGNSEDTSNADKS